MAASSKLMIVEAEWRFPCRIMLGVPIGGFGERLTEMQAWLDQDCGADGPMPITWLLPARSPLKPSA